MSFYHDFKLFYQSNILLFIILLFVIIYLIINRDFVSNGNYFTGEYVKPILLTGIIFLVFHMIMTWDDNSDNTISTNEYEEEKIINIPKFKFNNGINNEQVKNDIIASKLNVPMNPVIPIEPTMHSTHHVHPIPQVPVKPIEPTHSLNNKYKITNKFDLNQIKEPKHNHNILNNFPTSHIDDDVKLSNRNIFITHKNSSKYGLKF